jgi:hypothetical protein
VKNENKLKRRQMLKLSGAAAAGSILTGSGPVAARPAAKEASPVYRVLRPTGDVVHPMITQAPRLDTLEGKTICMTSNQGFKSHVTFPVIEKLLRQKYPNLKIISSEDMPRAVKPPAEGVPDPPTDAMAAALKQKGCQAVISGNGG